MIREFDFTTQEELADYLKKKEIVIIFFYVKGVELCEKFIPNIEQLEYEILKVDDEIDRKDLLPFPEKKYPCLKLMKNGYSSGQTIFGYYDLDFLKDMIQKRFGLK